MSTGTPRHAGLAYLFHSFASFGLGVILPQAFFEMRYSERVFTLLPISLALGAIAALAGQAITSRFFGPRAGDVTRAATLPILTCGLLLAAATGTLWWTTTAVGFIAIFIVMKFSAQSFLTLVDRRCVALVGPEGISGHAHRVALFDIGGIIIGPAFFGFAYAWPAAISGVVVVLGVIGCVVAAQIAGVTRPAETVAAGTEQPARRGCRSLAIQHFLLFALLTLSAMWILGTQLVPLVDGWYGLPNSVANSSFLVGLVYAVGVVSIALLPLFERLVGHDPVHGEWGPFRPSTNFGLTVGAIALTLMLHARPVRSYLFLAILAALAGVIFGIFQVTARETASHQSAAHGDHRMLDTFNNLPNYALLIASATVGLIDLLMGGSGSETMSPAIAGMLTLFTLALLAAGSSAYESGRQFGEPRRKAI